MSTISPLLRQLLQEFDENPDTWGQVLNDSALQVLEDSIAGTSVVSLVDATDYTLDPETTGGGASAADSFRYMIINVGGTPGGTTNIIAPSTSKVYLVSNATTDASDIVFKTSAGTGPTIPNGEAQWVFCDGTDILAASAATATSATTAATATNALALGGDPDTAFAKLAASVPFTAGQTVTRAVLADVAGDITPDLAVSNSFFHEMTQGENLAAPTNPTNGSMFSLVVEQGTGAPHTLTFQSNTFLWKDGVAPTLSTGVGDIDYLAFEYVTDVATTAKWIGSIIKGIA